MIWWNQTAFSMRKERNLITVWLSSMSHMWEIASELWMSTRPRFSCTGLTPSYYTTLVRYLSYVAKLANQFSQGCRNYNVSVKNLRSFIRSAVFDWQLKVDGGREGGERPLFHFFLWPLLIPLVQISFSPQLSTIVKIQDGSYSFHRENTEHSPSKMKAG